MKTISKKMFLHNSERLQITIVISSQEKPPKSHITIFLGAILFVEEEDEAKQLPGTLSWINHI